MIKLLKVSEGFCHNDLNYYDICLTPERTIYFIDFKDSGYLNIHDELGYVTLLDGISGEKLEYFLASYNGMNMTHEEIIQWDLTVYFDFSESKKDKKIELCARKLNLDKLLQ